MAFSDLASNQMVSYTNAQSSGFALVGGQSHVTSNECMTKSEILAKYVVEEENMSIYANNQLVPKSAWSMTIDTTPPSVPTGLSFIYFTDEQDLNGDSVDDEGWIWGASTDNITVTQYESQILKGVDIITTTSDHGLNRFKIISRDFYRDTYGTGEYCFRVRAGDAAGNWSAFSSPFCIILDAPADTTPPSIPMDLSASLISSTEISLNWTDATDDVAIAYYEVEMSTTSGTTGFANIGNPTTSDFYISGLTPSTNHLFRVRTRDTSNNLSDYSDVINQFTFE